MKPLFAGLAAAFALAAVIGVSATVAQKDPAMTAAAPLVTAAGLTCTITAARAGADVQIGKDEAKIYEVACAEGMGYAIIAKAKSTEPPTAYNCLQALTPGADGKPTALVCKLPANANPQMGLQPMLAKAGRGCQVDKARLIGVGQTQTYYEAACKDGTGLVLLAPNKPDGPALVAANCLQFAPDSKAHCTLTTPVTELAVVDGLAAATGKCTVKDKRFVVSDASGTDYFEVACTDGKGYILHADGSGKLKETIDCAVASGIAGGCTMTDTRAALTQQNALYTGIAKKAGFNCDVSRYAPFPTSGGDNEIVELQCSNRPDGGVGVFPLRGGAPHVYDCLRSLGQGFRCTFTHADALYGKLNGHLQSLNKGSCVVNGARYYGSSTDMDFVEVSCADGGPGWVIEYPKSAEKPDRVLNCAQAANVGAGGCQLPTNVKH
jgi:hypothetical protein